MVEAIGRRPEISAIVLTSGLPGYFVAHADDDDILRFARGLPTDGGYENWARAVQALEDAPQPLVAAINGVAGGGGVELALACTIRVASESATFAMPETTYDVIPGAGATQRLPRLVGHGRAAEMILSGRMIDAAEAERFGLVEAVLPEARFLANVLDWLGPIAEKPRQALVAAKASLLDAAYQPLKEGLAREAERFVRMLTSPEAVNLLAADQSGKQSRTRE